MIYCNDSQLSYNEYQTEFIDKQGLLFDESYRLAHLPLVAPAHPRIIHSKPGTGYNNGIHDLVYSIAIPIDAQLLFSSDLFNDLLNDIRNSSFAIKISWETFTQRRNKLHATVCGSISTHDAPIIAQQVFQQLREIGPLSIKLSGLFSGNKNIGRLYLKVYPEQRDGENMIHVIQRLFGTSRTDFYVVGLFNFLDELDATETQELKTLLNKWRYTDFIQLQVIGLWVLKSKDDLVLQGGIEQTLPMVPG